MSANSRDHPLVVWGVGLQRNGDADEQWIQLRTASPQTPEAEKRHNVDLLALRLREILAPHQVTRLITVLRQEVNAGHRGRPRHGTRKEAHTDAAQP
jgi:hypothetical protein